MSDQSIQPLFRLRVEYVKQGRLAYLGHLEVLHTIERIVRRARMPYAVTQGFSPHMRVAFSSALPVGTSSRSEWFDLHLTELVKPDEALERLRGASPVDLRPTRCAYID
ncbi:MAG: TIGR03936 family radical SAM-associated protein, partial [Collinsella sp.]|nr:TIGR03936 family radical SAM-associated protein [Collinsella sp.]